MTNTTNSTVEFSYDYHIYDVNDYAGSGPLRVDRIDSVGANLCPDQTRLIYFLSCCQVLTRIGGFVHGWRIF